MLPSFFSNDDAREDFTRLREGAIIGRESLTKRLRECACQEAISQVEEKKPPIGTGERFARLKSKIASKGKVSNPGAVAAAIGRKKYGSKRFAKLAAKGRKKAAREANVLSTNVPYLGRGKKKKKRVRETAATTFSPRTGAGSLSIGRTGIKKAKVKYSKLDVLGSGGYTVGPISLGRDAMYTGRQY